ncbi:MAG TPA: hypothetical protein VN612_13935 [Acidobacteriaceae bacterium]|nr:hypothetical protein [Acidobacteriaceae bacterium]
MASPDSPEAGPTDASDPHSPTLPGHTVDELRAQGKAAEARAEFERLIQEGVESGIDSRTPAAIFDSVRAEIRARASAQSTSDQDVQA